MAHGDTFRRNDNCQQPYNSELPVGLSTNPRLSTVMGSDWASAVTDTSTMFFSPAYDG